MLSNALIKTYLSDPANTVHVFTIPEAKKLIEEQGNTDSRITYILMENDHDVLGFLNSSSNYQLDRIHLTTVAKYFKAFYQFKPNCKLYFHFHNIELWFVSAFKIQVNRLWKVFSNFNSDVKIIRQLKYSAKDVLWDFYRKKFIRKIIHSDSVPVILSEAQRFHLSKHMSMKNAVIFPTLIFEPDTHRDLSGNNTKLRICVPGSVTQIRREYHKLLDVIETDIEYYKSKYSFDLLGFVPENEGMLLQRIKELIIKGADIIWYDHFISVQKFDEELFKSDLILSNILLGDGNGVQSKETAAVYHMIRGAKPGIFPESFQLDPEFEPSVIKFKDYQSLDQLFRKLAEDKDGIQTLKKAAQHLSKENSPADLLKRLVEVSEAV